MRERFEDPQAAFAARIEQAARRFVAFQRFAQTSGALLAAARRPLGVSQSLRYDTAMRTRILADVERGEMEAERPDAADEPPHLEQAAVLALVGTQAVGDEIQIAEELVGRIES
jgi:hypothetical protein